MKNKTPYFNVTISPPERITPFDNPNHFGDDYTKKIYSKEEVFSFWRYAMFHRRGDEFIDDCFDRWKERQKNKIWD